MARRETPEILEEVAREFGNLKERRRTGRQEALNRFEREIRAYTFSVKEKVARAVHDGVKKYELIDAAGISRQTIRNYIEEYLEETGYATLEEAFGGAAGVASGNNNVYGDVTFSIKEFKGKSYLRLTKGEGGFGNDCLGRRLSGKKAVNHLWYDAKTPVPEERTLMQTRVEGRTDWGIPEWVTDEVLDAGLAWLAAEVGDGSEWT